MASIGIVYFSGTGTTQKVAEHVQQGVDQILGSCKMFEIVGSDIVDGRWGNEEIATGIDECDAIIFGTPTYMGGVSSQLKAFFDAMAPRWYTQAWNGKVAAAFTVSSLASGDKLNCLQDVSTFAMQMGMIWVGTGASLADQINPNGFYLGFGASASTPDQLQEVDLQGAEHLGQRVASIVQRLTSAA